MWWKICVSFKQTTSANKTTALITVRKTIGVDFFEESSMNVSKPVAFAPAFQPLAFLFDLIVISLHHFTLVTY